MNCSKNEHREYVGQPLPVFDDILAARRRVGRHLIKTPLLESLELNNLVGGRVLIKAEPLQRTGSFKFRGAANRISQLTQDELDRGVVAHSSGNHAQAVTAAARIFGTRAVIVMPADAPDVKVRKTRANGGEIVFFDRYSERGLPIAERLSREQGLVFVPPFDDRHVIAGQGTLAVEVIEQAAELSAEIDDCLVGCGGGGLMAGCSLAFEAKSPRTRLFSVEAHGFDDTKRSLGAGQPVANKPGGRSVCDAILTDKPGSLTFAINKRLLDGGLVVTDKEALEAVAFAYDALKLVVEPGGVVALAAILAGKIDCRNRIVCVVCTGGNVDPDMFVSALHNRVPRAPGQSDSLPA